MTREEFIELLDEKGYAYELAGDKIVVTDGLEGSAYVHLDSLESLPPDVQFNNRGYVYLNSLETLPPGVEFKNGGYVSLSSLKELPPGVQFNNRGTVYLNSLIGGKRKWFNEWKGNIGGIEPNTLLNRMIEKGLFSR
jgi:hypothetical protein